MRDFAQRFWSKVDRSGGDDACWLWRAGCFTGYGQFYLNGKSVTAHSVALELTTGIKAPRGRGKTKPVVCHHCDNPPCCNPRHLFVGSHCDNARDRNSKGRANTQRGERCGASKLSESQVKEVFRLRYAKGYTHKRIAEMFGISRSGVGAILSGRHWKHIPEKEKTTCLAKCS